MNTHVANAKMHWCKNEQEELCKSISKSCVWVQFVTHAAMTETKYNQEGECNT